MVRRVGRIVIAAAAIGAAVLVGNAAVSVFHTAALRNESAAVLHSNELLLALDNVLSLVKDAESGQRGYVITGVRNTSHPTARPPRRSRRSWMRSSGWRAKTRCSGG
jgi:CHASE3 domain sensor protein